MAQPTEDEIEEQISKALISMDEGGSKWPGMSYEQGVEYSLRWILDKENNDPPMEEN